MKATLEAIARDLGIDTLEDSGHYEDSTVSKASLRRALEAAYRAGREAGAAAEIRLHEQRMGYAPQAR